MTLIGLLVAVVVIGLVIYLIQVLPIGAPFKNIALVIAVLICLFWLLSASGIGGFRLS